VRLPVNGTMPLTAVQTPLPRTRVPLWELSKHTPCALSLSSLHPATDPNKGNRLRESAAAGVEHQTDQTYCALPACASSIHLIVPPIKTHSRQGVEGGNKSLAGAVALFVLQNSKNNDNEAIPFFVRVNQRSE
jgi:hypothetical protein